MRKLALVGFMLGALVLPACQSRRSAGSSALIVRGGPLLRDVFTELGRLFEEQHPETALRSDFSCPPCVLTGRAGEALEMDVFVSAGDVELDLLADSGTLDPSTTRAIGSAQLVLVAPDDNPADLAGLGDLHRPQVKSIALGDPELTSPGRYAQQALRKMGLWDEVEGKLLLTKTGCEALKLVVVGQADAALLYNFCLEGDGGKPEVVTEVPSRLHDPIAISVTVGTGRASEATSTFIELVESAAAQEILRKHGVGPAPGSGPSAAAESGD